MVRLLLFLSVTRLHAQVMAHGKIVSQHDFSNSIEGQENFTELLKTARHPTYLLTDLIEEDFRQETVPHLSGRARYAQLGRKFEQFYRGTPFHQATLLHRQKNGRRDDDILFSALTNPQLIKPWLDIMRSRQIPLAGIYSVPQISAPLVRDHPSKHLLLISWEKYSGLRQTYFSNHRLQISRLTPVNADMTFMQAVLEELARTYQYLKSLSLLPPGQTLDVRLLGHGSDFTKLKQELSGNADMRYDFADLELLARQHRIDYQFTDSDASQIFLHQLAANPPKTHYANADHTHYFALWQLRQALNLAGGALLSGMLLWGMYSLWQSNHNAAETLSIKKQAQQALNQTQRITFTFPNTYAPAADMKAGVSVMHQHHPYDSMPIVMLHQIGAILERHPKIELDHLSWKLDTASNTEPSAQFILKGRLVDFENDYRAALTYFEKFRSDMALQACQVEVLGQPFDVSPTGSIADQREAQSNILDFSVKIFRRPPP